MAHSYPRPVSLRDGFTMIEMFVVIVLIAVLSAVAFGKFNGTTAARSASGARDSFVWLGRRARALAVQRGQIVRLTLNPAKATGRLWLGRTGATKVSDGLVAFDQEFKVTVTASVSDSIIVCYTPRGFALTSACSTPNLPQTATFTRGQSSAIATVQPLGQVEANP